MKIGVQSLFIVLALFAGLHQAAAQGTAFTYQGRLNSGANSVSGNYDLRVGLYDAVSSGTQQGVLLTNSAVAISNGLFTVTLDFGNQFPGANRWLEIGVRTNGSGAFTTLAPRQPITPTPYAIYSANAGAAISATSATLATTANNFSGTLAGDVTGTQDATVVANVGTQTAANIASGTSAANAATSLNTPGTIVKRDGSGGFAAGTIAATNFTGNGGGLTNLNATKLTSGTVPLAQLPSAVVTNGASGVSIAGSFTGNGAGVTNLNLSINSAGAIQPLGGFGLASSPGVGSGPQSVVTADVNGDGLPDLICANSLDDTLTVLTNNGSGGFGSNATINVGSGPHAVIAADVNNDGKVDLICANANGLSLTVLTNNGSGGFVIASSPGTGLSPNSLVAADINGDGKLDLISANENFSGTLTVLTNRGGGNFGFNATLSVGHFPSAITAADINGDGKPDLICANNGNGANTLTVLTNNGSGVFGFNATLNVGSQPIAVIAADVNGDGKPDLISANGGPGANSLTVLTNNGSGGFVLASTPTVGAAPSAVVAADVNNDGKLDLICANSSDNTLTVLLNSGGGNFVYSSSPTVGNSPQSVAAADFNKDGKVDLATANFSDGTLSVLLNSATFIGTFAGNGSGLTGLDAGQLTGTVPSAQLSGTYNGAVVFGNIANSFSGDGSGLLNLNASQLTFGTVQDSVLSANVALRAGGNNFSGDQVVSGTFRIGQGTVFTNVQDGIFTAGTNSAGIKVVTNAFPVAFGSVPTITTTPVSQAGTDLPDVYGLTVRRVTTTNFVVNILRLDVNGAAWTNSLRVSYHAWQ